MLKRLKEILAVQTYSYETAKMEGYIFDWLTNYPDVACEFNNGNIYLTKGHGPYPCVVAHTDTVHDIVEDLTVIKVGDNLTGFNAFTMEQTGIGGDDKVGIFICLELLRTTENIKVVFFRDEEVGCDGSYQANMDFFKDVNFVLQFDRNGNTDFVVNASGVQLSGAHFQNSILPIIQNYGYDFANGMMTDVMALKEMGLAVCAANMSCGYYNPHTPYEFVNIPDVLNTLNMATDILNTLGHMPFPHMSKVKRAVYKYKIPPLSEADMDFWGLDKLNY